MRTSPDYYRTFDGKVWAVFLDTRPPLDSQLIYGYDYNKQKWVVSGKKLIERLFKNKVKIEVFK